MIHLDTSFLVDLLREARRRKPGPAIELLHQLGEQHIGISVFVLAELRTSVLLCANPEAEGQRLEQILASLETVYPDARFAREYARVLAALKRARKTIATMDLMIGTMALLDEAKLVTRNRKHFKQIPNLVLIDY